MSLKPMVFNPSVKAVMKERADSALALLWKEENDRCIVAAKHWQLFAGLQKNN